MFKEDVGTVRGLILNAESTKIVRLIRKEACYCRDLLAVVVDLAVIVGRKAQMLSYIFSEE